jgi:pyrroline-5-carboxylate reductase
MTEGVVLVGCGNMGYAMLAGWVRSGTLTLGEVAVVEPNETLRQRAADLGAETGASVEALALDKPRLIVLAVKPQVVLDVAKAYRPFAEAGTTIVSVAAGISIAALAKVLGDKAPIIRCMPNTPAAIGKGMMVLCDNGKVDKATAEFVEELLGASGKVARVGNEELMHAVTAVSGSGPAYVFHFIECLTAAARKAGLPDDVARLLAMQTVYGAASLAADSGEDPGTLRRQVTSPNGTTQAALEVLMGDDRLEKLVEEAVDAARRRSIELGS